MGLLSFSVVKFWQGMVEIILRIVSIILVAITFFTCIAAASDLSAPRTEIRFIEDLRFDTRSPVGWLLLLGIFALPITLVLLILRFLDIKFIATHRSTFLFLDIVIEMVLTVGYFCGAVPLAAHVSDWRYWRGQGSDEDNEFYNINSIITSTEASATFAFFTTFSLIAVGVWLILFLLLNWGPPRAQEKSEFTPRVQMVGAGQDEVSIITSTSNGKEPLDV